MSALAAIHVGKKQLDLDDEDYRSLLQRITGKRSAGEMTLVEQGAVVDEMRRLGFRDGVRPSKRRATGRYAAKLQALWIAGFNLGVVRSKDDAAMIAFVERQTGLSHTRFLVEPADAAKAIEALKKWLDRDGGVDWSTRKVRGTNLPAYVNLPQYRIVMAQVRKLRAADATGLPPDNLEFSTFSGADWIALMNELGFRVRKFTANGNTQRIAS
jgi:phage gp16-like protein